MLKYTISKKEYLYSTLMVLFGIAGYSLIGSLMTLLPPETTMVLSVYIGLYVCVIFLSPFLLKGLLVGSSIKLSPSQFPQYYSVIEKMSQDLGLKTVPQAYIIQSGGSLNAFATRLFGRNYVVLFSGILSKAESEGQDALNFIIGHELGHIKRNHVSFWFSLLTLPSHLVPFLFKAYSRAREYTCDSIGASLAPQGAEKGLVLLAAGKELASSVNVDEMLATYNQDRGLSSWLANIFSTHPLIANRILALRAEKAKSV